MVKAKSNPKVTKLLDQLASSSPTKVNKTFSLDADVYKKLEALCSKKKIPVSRVVNGILIRFLTDEEE